MAHPALSAFGHHRPPGDQCGVSSRADLSIPHIMIKVRWRKPVYVLNDIFIKIFLVIFYIVAIGASFVLRSALTARTPVHRLFRPRNSRNSYWQTNTGKEKQSPGYFHSPY